MTIVSNDFGDYLRIKSVLIMLTTYMAGKSVFLYCYVLAMNSIVDNKEITD